MPSSVVSRVGQEMGVLDGVVIVEGEGAVLKVNLGHPVVTNGTLLRSSARATHSLLSERTCSDTCKFGLDL